jgi:hypothetical protein
MTSHDEFRRILKNAHRSGWKYDRYLEGWDDAVDHIEVAFERIYGKADVQGKDVNHEI